MNDVREITELLGDGIAEELKKSLHSVADALPESYLFDTVDLSHENRKKGARQLYNQAVESMKRTCIGIKYPTATVEESPNAVLRKLLKFSVIHRPVTTIPGIKTNFTGKIDLDIVRIATGGTYDDPGQMIGDYAAASLRVVDRKTCEQAAHYAFSIAMREGKTLTSSSKYTIQRVTDGLFEDIVDDVADEPRYKDIIEHRRELFDALLAKLAMDPEQFQVVLVLNEYGDFLSDLASGLVGSLGLGASMSLSFDEKGEVLVRHVRCKSRHRPRYRRTGQGQPYRHPFGLLHAFKTYRQRPLRGGASERYLRVHPRGRDDRRPGRHPRDGIVHPNSYRANQASFGRVTKG